MTNSAVRGMLTLSELQKKVGLPVRSIQLSPHFPIFMVG